MNWRALVLVALVGFGLYQHRQQQPVDPGAGVVAPAAPVQANTQSAGFQFNGYELQPLQDFAIDALSPFADRLSTMNLIRTSNPQYRSVGSI